MLEIEICFANDREYERLRHIREKYGVQWRGMLIQGAKRLEGHRRTTAAPWIPRERDVPSGCLGRSTEDDHDHVNADTGVERGRFSAFR